jgi:phospholipid/cholesterol/gamma-HCH transport system permease protein
MESMQGDQWQLAWRRVDDTTVELTLSGDWRLRNRLPAGADIVSQLQQLSGVITIRLDGRAVDNWDSGLVTVLRSIRRYCDTRQMDVDDMHLPGGARQLLQLANAVPEISDTGRHGDEASLLSQVGETTLALLRGAPAMVAFVGEAVLALGRFVIGRARYRRVDLFLTIQEVGPQALPIVSLISFLVGLILAYMGAVQLARFGAQIYIADLVGIGIVREIGPLMTAVIMAGRSGAAFAAQLGTMQVNEEIDAFKTMGVPPVEFLVLPRMLALILMVPLLTLYCNVVGMVAGMLVAVTAFDVDMFEYYHQTLRALDLRHILIGLSKSAVYGVLIALAGCLRGMQCGRSAAAVGQATTSAVVTSIVFIVVSASVLTIIYQQFGI